MTSSFSPRQGLFAGLLLLALLATAGNSAEAHGGGSSGGSHGLSAGAHLGPMPSMAAHQSQARHHRPPAGRGGPTSSASDAVIDQSISAPMQTQVPSPPASTGRNPALTGGTDPAIGQPSPPVTDTIASSGGLAVVDHSGGGGNTLADCMGFWDRTTHMSRAEWRQTCNRTLNGIDLPVEIGGTPAPSRSARHADMRPKQR